MKFTVLIALFLCIHLCVSGQKKDAYIESRIDSAWRTVQIHRNPELAMEISEELLGISEQQGSYRAAVSAHQVIAEALYHENSADSAMVHYQIALQLAERENDQREAAFILQAMGQTEDRKGNFDSAIALHHKSLEKWTVLRDTTQMLYATLKKATLYEHADRHYLSLEEYFKVLEMAKTTKDSLGMISAFVGMGIVHKKQENYERAKQSYFDAIHISELMQDEFEKAYATINLALVYKSEGDYQEAYDIFERLYLFFKSESDEHAMMICRCNQAICSNRLGKYVRALDEGMEGIELSRKFFHKEAEADVANEIGIAYLGLGEVDEALKWSLNSREITKEIHSLEKKRDNEKTLSDIYFAKGDYENALVHFKNYVAFKDTFFEERKSNQILELHTQYETVEKEMEIALLETANVEERYQKRGIVAGSITLILLAMLIIYREKQKRKKAKQLHDTENALAQTKEDALREQLNFKRRELTAKALHISQKQEMIEELKSLIEENMNTKSKIKNPKQILQLIRFDSKIDDQWDQFMQTFTEANAHFLENLLSKHPNLSKTELRISALIKMNLNNKEIANIMGITDEGIKKARYRLRKKLNLENVDNLDTYILSNA